MKCNQKFKVAFVGAKTDWEAKKALYNVPSWSSMQPCYVCTISKRKGVPGLPGSSRRIRTRSTVPFQISNKDDPLIRSLPYVDETCALPMDIMHTYFVHGIVPTLFCRLFEKTPNFLNEKGFFSILNQIEFCDEHSRIFQVRTPHKISFTFVRNQRNCAN